MSLTQDTHVQVATKHGRIWSKAWSTGVDGLVVVHDPDHDRWSVTHRASGKAVVALQAAMVNLMRVAAHQLRTLDWTVAEDAISDEHRQAAAEALAHAAETAPAVTPATERGVGSV
jgi:hypothetical protein